MMASGGARVHEDDVVLGRPPRRAATTIVVRPDHLIEKAIAAEDLVEQHLAVMRLARIDVEVQGAVRRQDPATLLEPRPQPSEVVVERVLESSHVGASAPVRGAAKASTFSSGVAHSLQSEAVAPRTGIERRVGVHEARAPRGQLSQQ
jgi:hypothetical protein